MPSGLTEGQGDSDLRAKLTLLAVLFVSATAAIVHDVAVYHGTPSEAEKAEAERMRPQLARNTAVTRDAIAYDHDNNLAELQKELAPQAESRCQGFHRRRLRNAVERYVDGRLSAWREAARNPLLAGVEKLYDTPDDKEALRDAHDLLNQGFLLASDFPTWTEGENAIFPLPVGVSSICSRAMEDAEKDAPG